MLRSWGAVVWPITLAVALTAYLAPPSTQLTTAASPNANVAFDATELPALPASVLTALPMCPVRSFLPALRTWPPCWTAVQALPTSPLTRPPTSHRGLIGLNARAGGAAAPIHNAPPATVATTSCLSRAGTISAGGAAELLEEVHEPRGGADDQRRGA